MIVVVAVAVEAFVPEYEYYPHDLLRWCARLWTYSESLLILLAQLLVAVVAEFGGDGSRSTRLAVASSYT